MAKRGKQASGDNARPSARPESWKVIMQQGIHAFIQKQPTLFRRRVQRGIPVEHRWEVWKAAVCMEERARPGFYQELLAIESEWTRLIEIDIPRTFPEMPFFDKEQQQSLLRVLHAFANYTPEVGYCQGMNFVAGLLLMVAQNGDFRCTPRLDKEEETFWMLVCLMGEEEGAVGRSVFSPSHRRPTAPAGTLSGFYKKDFPLLRRYLWAFDQLVGASLGDLREHLDEECVQHAVYLHQWFLTLFVNCLPMPMVLLFWDQIVCTGLESLLPITVALLQLLRGVLLELRFEDIVRFFKTMRACDEDCEAVTVARLVVAESRGVEVPERILTRLRAPLQEDECLETPTTPSPGFTPSPRRQEESLGLARSPGISGGSPLGGSDGLEGETASSGVLESYFPSTLQQFSNLRRDLSDIPQGIQHWLEDARDNLERVGLGVPQRSGEPSQRDREQTRLLGGAAGTSPGRSPGRRQARPHKDVAL